MDSLFELEGEVYDFMHEHKLDDGRSLWVGLVESSRNWKGAGCDGILLGQAERFVEERLNQLSEGELAAIWPETEGGMMSIAEGYAETCDEDMIADIGIEMTERIAEAVCEEARQRKPKRDQLPR